MAVGLIIGVLVWVVGWSSLLVVRSVRVLGTAMLSPEQVRQAAAVPLDTPLIRVEADATADRVRALAPVQSVEVRRGWPNEVVLVVTERVPVAVLPADRGFQLVDGSGVAFAPVAAPPAGLLVVDARGGSEVRRAALDVLTGLPARVRAQVVQVAATTRDDVRLRLRDGATVVWGSVERGDLKARVLVALLPQDALAYDVSAPELPTTRPSKKTDPAPQ